MANGPQAAWRRRSSHYRTRATRACGAAASGNLDEINDATARLTGLTFAARAATITSSIDSAGGADYYRLQAFFANRRRPYPMLSPEEWRVSRESREMGRADGGGSREDREAVGAAAKVRRYDTRKYPPESGDEPEDGRAASRTESQRRTSAAVFGIFGRRRGEKLRVRESEYGDEERAGEFDAQPRNARRIGLKDLAARGATDASDLGSAFSMRRRKKCNRDHHELDPAAASVSDRRCRIDRTAHALARWMTNRESNTAA